MIFKYDFEVLGITVLVRADVIHEGYMDTILKSALTL